MIKCVECGAVWLDEYDGTHCDCGLPIDETCFVVDTIMPKSEYEERAMAKMADQREILEYRKRYTDVRAVQFDNGVTGLQDEVGELSAVKKRWLEYQQPMTEEIRMNVLEECGDIFWRTVQILDAFGFTMEQAQTANLAKLEQVRYKDGRCNPKDAANRDTEAEATAMSNSLRSVEDSKLGERFLGVKDEKDN